MDGKGQVALPELRVSNRNMLSINLSMSASDYQIYTNDLSSIKSSLSGYLFGVGSYNFVVSQTIAYVTEVTQSEIFPSRFFASRTFGCSGHHRYSGADCAAEPDAVDIAG